MKKMSVSFACVALAIVIPQWIEAQQTPPGAPQIAWMGLDYPAPATYQIAWNMWWGHNGNRAKLEENGQILATAALTPNSPQAQQGQFTVADRPAGSYEFVVLLCAGEGQEEVCTASGAKTITVNSRHYRE